jgi:hypothetical protein
LSLPMKHSTRFRFFEVDWEDTAGGNDGSSEIRVDHREVVRVGFRTVEEALEMDLFPVVARYLAERG